MRISFMSHFGNTSLKSSQHGAALVVSLIILLIMTLLGVAALNTTMLEEKMAGNAKNYNISFQAAEAGLRAGENYVASQNIAQFQDNCTDGFCSYATGSEAPRWKDPSLDVWNTNGKHRTDNTLAGESQDPQYIIEQLPASMDQSGGSLVRGFGAGTSSTFYTITARGVDATGTAVVYLQSIFRK